jgi:eukaryotic-like serine/threonine-protein kinase
VRPRAEVCRSGQATPEVGAPRSVIAAPLEAGTAIGRYVITGVAGEGGMGVVYRVYDPRLRREVALKRLRSRKGRELDAMSKARLLAEARAMASLSHPNVLPVYDVEEIGGDLCITMEYVEGVTLRAWCRHNNPSWFHVVDELIEAGQGLAAAHRAGLVHRDFKPTNAMIGSDGRVRVMDFGLATRKSDVESSSMAIATVSVATVDEPEDSDPKTEEGVVMGTPAYMAPEQHDGLPADARSDQFAFCVSAFELLYGRRPFEAKGSKALAQAKKEGKIRKISGRSPVPRRLHRILVRGMAAEPALRWPSMDALLAALRRIRAWRRRRPMVMAGSGLAIATAAYALAGDPPCDATQRLEQVWNHERAARIEAELRAGSAGRVEHGPGLERAIDDHAHAWIDAYRETCHRDPSSAGPWARAASDGPRRWCLADHLRGLDVALSLLESDEPRGTRRPSARHIVASLPDPDDCAAADRRSRSGRPDARIADEVRMLERDLWRVRILADAGSVRDALSLVETLDGRVTATGYDPLRARHAAIASRVHGRLGRHAEAARLGREGYYLALAEGDDLLAIEQALLLASVSSQGLRSRDAEAWLDHAAAFVERASASDTWRARVEHVRGAVLHAAGDLEQARDALLAALTLIGSDDAPASVRQRSMSHNALGLVQRDLGQLSSARGQLEEAQRLQEALLGPGQSLDGTVAINLATVRAGLGDHDGAMRALEGALADLERGYGSDGWPALIAAGNIANVFVEQERFAEAEIWFEHMERGLEAIDRSGSIEYAVLQADRARLAVRLGRGVEARTRWQRAIAVLVEQSLHATAAGATLQLDYARFLLREGDVAQAHRLLDSLEEEVGESLGSQHALVLEVRVALGEALLGLDRPEAALQVLRPLELGADSASDFDPDRRAWLRFFLARALWEARPAEREDAWRSMVDLREVVARSGADAELLIQLERWIDERRHRRPS